MILTEQIKQTYTDILKEELLSAMGCTEPIAIAYAASILRDALGIDPETLRVGLSGNIIKNVKSVIVPATGGMHGIGAAVAAGIVAACPQKRLEVLCGMGQDDHARMAAYLQAVPPEIYELDTKHPFELLLEGRHGGDVATVHMVHRHTHIAKVVVNGIDVTHVYAEKETESETGEIADRSLLSVEAIVAFADEVDLTELKPLLLRQMEMNMAIAEEGLTGKWGASIGALLCPKGDGADPVTLRNRARAYAAAGSDARMSGCEMPVCILSGSGNQGITASVPVVIYAQAMGADDDTLMRALLVSDLITIHQKTVQTSKWPLG